MSGVLDKSKNEVFDLMLMWIIGMGHVKSCPQVHASYHKDPDPRYRECTCGFVKLVKLAEEKTL